MRRLFWLIIMVGAYFWVLTSGRDQFFLQKAKAVVQFVTQWIDDADADFQLKNTKSKKKSRRWD
jgi:hypothetical protein